MSTRCASCERHVWKLLYVVENDVRTEEIKQWTGFCSRHEEAQVYRTHGLQIRKWLIFVPNCPPILEYLGWTPFLISAVVELVFSWHKSMQVYSSAVVRYVFINQPLTLKGQITRKEFPFHVYSLTFLASRGIYLHADSDIIPFWIISDGLGKSMEMKRWSTVWNLDNHTNRKSSVLMMARWKAEASAGETVTEEAKTTLSACCCSGGCCDIIMVHRHQLIFLCSQQTDFCDLSSVASTCGGRNKKLTSRLRDQTKIMHF